MQLHHKHFGSGNPMVILHGLFGMLDNWRSFARRYEGEHLLYLLDQRNHGRSPHDPTMNYPMMANDIKETMEQQWLYDGAIIMGHSMGGKAAMQLALEYADLVQALIVVDIAPRTYEGSHEHIIEALMSIPIAQKSAREEISRILSAKIQSQGVVRFLMKNLARRDEGGFTWRCNLDSIAANYKHLLASPQGEPYPGPALFVKGSESPYIRAEDEQLILEHFPKATIVDISGAGHWVHIDQPDTLHQSIRHFIRHLDTH